MESCLLCHELGINMSGSIKVNSTQWQAFKIEQLIDLHLWPVPTPKPSSWLCTTCWQELYDFHKFYTRIGEVNKRMESAIKTEITNDSYFVPQLLVQETISSELIIENEKIFIKEENNEYLSEKDDDPVIQTNKTRPQTVDKTIIDPAKTSIKLKPTKIQFREKYPIIPTNNTRPQIENKTIIDPPKTSIKLKPTKTQIREKEYCKNDTVEQFHEIKLNPSLIDIKDKNYSNNNALKELINQQKDNFIAENIKLTCELCERKMLTFQDLCQHFKMKHNQQGYIKCCNKTFYQRIYLSDHLHQHLDPNYLKCDQCDRILGSRRSLELHKRTHDNTRKKNHVCDTCGMRFLTRHVLNTHKTRHLTEEEKLFPCLICGKKYGSKWTLVNHVRAIHDNITSCDICGLIVTNKSVLKRHKSVKHAVEKPKEITCEICSKVCPNIYAYKVHVNFVHELASKFKCTICERAFKRSRALKEHIATHTGTNLYTCTWCPKTCKAMGNMKVHRKKCHPKEWGEELNRKNYARNNTANIVGNEPMSANS